MSDTKKKSGKPSNAELLAERKAIAELLNYFGDDNNVDKVKAAVEMIGALKETVRKLSAPATPIQPIPAPNGLQLVPPQPPPPGSVPDEGQRSGPPSLSAPLDAAYYPRPGEYVPPERHQNFQPSAQGAPPMSNSQGDMTPAYARWYLATQGPEATRRKYGPQRPEEAGRIHLLPEDVKGALA